MTDASPPALANDIASPLRSRAQETLYRRSYPLRILGMGLAGLPLIAVLHELDTTWFAWAWVVMICLIWPHLAYWLAKRSRDPFNAELRNLVVDTAIAGSCIPLLHFNLLPSAILLTVAVSDKISTGVRRLWVWSLPGAAIALFAVAWLNGFAFQPESSMRVILACLPLMIIHTIAVSATSYRLVRRVQTQNQRLEELSRVDTLTGLFSRGHWESLATAALQVHEDSIGSALMVLDIDQFKEINDQYGHAAGDDVLRGIADLIRRNSPAGSHAGRLGGDEFAVVMPFSLEIAESAAERIRIAVQALQFNNTLPLRCTVSIGIAGKPDVGADLRTWIESADRALYRAKQAGRNRAATA
ncbi:sensor domain-containing diguanylate cyclase [Dokdonella sp.]|uniref:sensor domain-containing diguanylate cyclase n=1 Tax=Dokdonella sp. TaxID=2291710 RepID=UPI003C4F7560